MRRRILLAISLVLALMMFSHSSPPPVKPTTPKLQNVFVLEVVACPEATSCVMNIVGKDGLLGQQVAVWVGSYQAPSANYYGCRLEQIKGKIAATFLQETLRSAGLVILMNAHKKRGSPYLTGNLMVDGQDVTVLMFGMKLAVPRGIKVDWCEKVGKGFEV